MLKYILGLFLNLFNKGVSFFALTDNKSIISRKAKVYRKCKIFNSTIGAYSYLAPGTSIVCTDIGKFCSIAQNVRIGLGKHNMNFLSTSPIFYSKKNATGFSWTLKNSFEEYSRVNKFEF